jgi:hypothetical protein
MPKTYTADQIIYSLSKNPKEILVSDYSPAQAQEVAKARARLHRMTGGFTISSRTVQTKIHIFREGN